MRLAPLRLPVPGQFVKIVQVYLKYLTRPGRPGLLPAGELPKT